MQKINKTQSSRWLVFIALVCILTAIIVTGCGPEPGHPECCAGLSCGNNYTCVDSNRGYCKTTRQGELKCCECQVIDPCKNTPRC